MPAAKRFRILISILLISSTFSLAAQSTGAGISVNKWPVQLKAVPYFFSLQPDLQKKNHFVQSPGLILPGNMATAFFCRMEVKAEKASIIPVLFRLGSVDHVERMEGKRKDMFIR